MLFFFLQQSPKHSPRLGLKSLTVNVWSHVLPSNWRYAMQVANPDKSKAEGKHGDGLTSRVFKSWARISHRAFAFSVLGSRFSFPFMPSLHSDHEIYLAGLRSHATTIVPTNRATRFYSRLPSPHMKMQTCKFSKMHHDWPAFTTLFSPKSSFRIFRSAREVSLPPWCLWSIFSDYTFIP